MDLQKNIERNLFPGQRPAQASLIQIIADLESALAIFLKRPIKPSSAKSLVPFFQLAESQQTQAINSLTIQLDFVREAITCGLDAYNEGSLVRLAMKKLSLFADENLVEKVEPTDIVEIFSPDQTQVYRSFSCFALCNYTIAELVTYPWYDLYERPSMVEDKILELALPVLHGESGFRTLTEVFPPYVLVERMTEEKSAFRVQEKFYARMISGLNRKPYLLSVKSIVPLETNQGTTLRFL